MAIVWVHEAQESGRGEGSYESGSSYTRVFDVLTNSYDDNAITVANANDGSLAIPQAFAYFTKGNDTDYGSVVTRRSAERDDQYPLLWHVTVEYTVVRSTDGEPLPGGTFDITYQLPNVRIWGIPITEVMRKDVNGNPIQNSAGVPFKPLPEDIRYITAIEVTSWVRNYNVDFWAPYADSVNADTIWSRAPGTLLMVGPPNGNRKVDGIGTYWEVRVEVHWDKNGWAKEYEDRGRAKLVNDFGTEPSPSDPAAGTAPITDIAGIPVDEDVPLNGQGQPLAFGQPRVYLPFTIKESRAWAPLNLPPLNILW